jgi:hypothetical protein
MRLAVVLRYFAGELPGLPFSRFALPDLRRALPRNLDLLAHNPLTHGFVPTVKRRIGFLVSRLAPFLLVVAASYNVLPFFEKLLPGSVIALPLRYCWDGFDPSLRFWIASDAGLLSTRCSKIGAQTTDAIHDRERLLTISINRRLPRRHAAFGRGFSSRKTATYVSETMI